MAPRKGRTGRKSAAGKSPRKRVPATKSRAVVGHNKPPDEAEAPRGAPPPQHWHIEDTASQVARDNAAYRRRSIAATRNVSGGPPFALGHDRNVLHQAMLKHIAALEETIAKLPTSSREQLKRLLDEFEEIESLITRLKSEPAMPAKPPAYAIQLQGKLMALGEKVLESLATDAVKQALSAAALALWAAYADQLIALAKAIGDWIASLPPLP
jgi:hypothetical protein